MKVAPPRTNQKDRLILKCDREDENLTMPRVGNYQNFMNLE